MKRICVFCENGETAARELGGLVYHFCPGCGGIFLDSGSRLSPSAEKARYDLHQNSLLDAGYRTYLESFLDGVLEAVTRSGEPGEFSGGNVRIRTVFDYGSGPEPALVRLLSQRGFEARGYDPFFSPDVKDFPGGADLVTCLEVAEHFCEPHADFRLLAGRVRPGGWCAVGTRLLETAPRIRVDERESGGEGETSSSRLDAAPWESFNAWWYRQDRTHVSFYTAEALRICAEQAGLELSGPAGPHAYLFRKPEAAR